MAAGKALGCLVSAPILLIIGFVVVLGGGEDDAQAQGPSVVAGPPSWCASTTTTDAEAGGTSGDSAGSSVATTSIPVTSASAAPAVPVDVSSLGLNADQTQIAQTIVGVVKGRGLSQRAAEIALATGWVESNLRNLLVAVDHDSLGVFQQRPSVLAWGTAQEIVDVVHATNAFLDAMVEIGNWETADPGWVAQSVQQSALPDAYNDKGMPLGVPLAAALWPGGGGAVVPCTAAPTAGPGSAPGGPVNASGAAKVALERARSQIGLPYCWAGGDASGPTHGEGGDGCGGGAVGFDCSGLMIYAWAGSGVVLPHRSAIQATMGTHVPIAQAAPGDLVFWDDGGGVHHVAMIYSLDPGTTTGAGEIIEAQTFGVPVHIRRWTGTDNPEVLPYAARFGA